MAEKSPQPETVATQRQWKEVPPPPEIEVVLAPIETGVSRHAAAQDTKQKVSEIMADLRKVLPQERRVVIDPSLAVKEKLGSIFYRQYAQIKDKRLGELVEPEKKEEVSAWEKAKSKLKKWLGGKEEEVGDEEVLPVNAEQQLALNKLRAMYASIGSPIEAYATRSLTVEQFLIKYLRQES